MTCRNYFYDFFTSNRSKPFKYIKTVTAVGVFSLFFASNISQPYPSLHWHQFPVMLTSFMVISCRQWRYLLVLCFNVPYLNDHRIPYIFKHLYVVVIYSWISIHMLVFFDSFHWSDIERLVMYLTDVENVKFRGPKLNGLLNPWQRGIRQKDSAGLDGDWKEVFHRWQRDSEALQRHSPSESPRKYKEPEEVERKTM